MSDHVIHLGDCLDPLTGLASLADKSVDHMITDLPFGESTVAGARKRARFQQRQLAEAFISYEGFSCDQARGALMACARVARRWVIAAMEWRHAAEIADSPPPGLKFIRAGVFIKTNGSPQFSGDRPGMGWEMIAIFHAEGEKCRWNGGGSNAWWIHEAERNNGHPTPKPLALYETLISDFTDPGDMVCDPFAGSGTTLVACKRLGRRAIGWELNGEYHERAVRRLENTRQQYELLPRGPKAKQVKMVLP